MERIRSIGRDERGVALVLALVSLVVLTIATTSAVGYVTSNQTAAADDVVHLTAERLAFAGLNMASSVLQNPANVHNLRQVNLLPATTTSLDGGTVTWQGTYTAASRTWALTATGTATRSPSGSYSRTETATVLITNLGGGNFSAGPLTNFR